MSYPFYINSLSEFTVDEIKQLLTLTQDFFPDNFAIKTSRKDDLIHSLSSLFSSQEVLKKFYRTLSTLEQSTLQEIVHTSNGCFYPEQITAKYGSSPKMRVSYRDKDTKISPITALLSKKNTLPLDLLLRLKALIPHPKKTSIKELDTLPEKFFVQKHSSTQDFPLIIHKTETAALSDLTTLLNLCEDRSIGVGETTGNVSATGASKIQAILSSGDFYAKDVVAPDDYDAPFGALGIRSFAWPKILQIGKIAKAEKNKLTFSRSGKKSLSTPKHEVIRSLWDAWLKNTDFHELSRIDVFKGQKSKSRPLNKPAPAREMIVKALQQLPSEKWVFIDDFFSFIIASKLNFEIAKNPWALYISDPEYGSLGYDHIQWRHINGRFTLAFLLEYAATLGIIDVALTSPWGSVYDFSDFWGTDGLSCLSRYDGLKYIRLTKLGEWILKEQESYTEILTPLTTQFQLSSNLKHETIIKEIKEDTSPKPILTLLESLESENNQLTLKGDCTLIECQDVKTANLIASSEELKKFTFLLNDKDLVILKGHEKAFCKVIKKLGLTPPRKLEKSKK